MNRDYKKSSKKQSRKAQLVHWLIYSSILILCLLVGFFNFFEKIDFRLYDFTFKLKKEIPTNEKIVLVCVDDMSIEELGEWPWPRDIIGDALIRMKEFGAKTASFDIEYLSPSPLGVSKSARTLISQSFEDNKDIVSQILTELSRAAVSGAYSRAEIEQMTKEALGEYINPAFDDTSMFILDNIYQNNDEYFGKAVQFFGNTFLTVNNNDLQIKISSEHKTYVHDRLLYENLKDPKDFITRDNDFTFKDTYSGLDRGFTPALQTLVSRARGVGFTNSCIDSDGVRRRFEPFYIHNGKYLAQLAVSPLLYILDVQSVTRNRHNIVLHGAKFPDLQNPIDLKIPLDSHGRVLINWKHSEIGKAFHNEPLYNLKQLDFAEENIYQQLQSILQHQVLSLDGRVLPYTIFSEQLCEMYSQILAEKERLLSKCTGFDVNNVPFDGITDAEYDAYFAMRKEFFSYVDEFLSADFLPEINACLDELKPVIGEENTEPYRQEIIDEFAGLKQDRDFYKSYTLQMKPWYEGAYCILGNTATSTTDLGATPFQKQYENVGLHANLMNTILERNFVYPVSWLWGFIFAVLISLVPFAFGEDKKRYRNISGGAVVILGITFYSVLFFSFDIYIPSFVSILYLVVNYSFGVLFRFVTSEKEKKFITNAFGQCLSKDVVDDIINNPSSLKLGGVTRDMTAIFTDIQKFSTFSELLNAAQLVALLNYYLTRMSNIIMDERGTVDKYEGDAIIALVGAPLELSDHAFRACSAAIKMKKAEDVMNKEIQDIAKSDKPLDMDQDLYDAFKIMVANEKTIFTRIGINSGEMVAGFMGSENKKNYTMMGNNVNLASRLEGVNKAYSSSIMCSDAAWERANSGDNYGKIIVKRIDRVRVVGISKPVQLYNLIGFSDEVPQIQMRELEVFHAGLDRYLNREFADAKNLFMEADKIFHDETALVFADRCQKYIEQGVTEEWDGILTMTSK